MGWGLQVRFSSSSLCRRALAVEVMVDLGGVVILNSRWRVIQYGQQILLHVPHLCGVLTEAVEYEADVLAWCKILCKRNSTKSRRGAMESAQSAG